MTYLTNDQLKMLIKLTKNESLKYESLSKDEKKIVRFLESENLIDTSCDIIPHINLTTGHTEILKGRINSFSISEKGKSYFVENIIDTTRYRHPVTIQIIQTVISALALIISVLALCLSAYAIWLQSVHV